MAFLRASLAGLAAWLSQAPLTHACSTIDSYVPPSAFELVEMADAIVVATAIGGTPFEANGESHVRFRVESVLKGEPPKAFDNDGYGLVDPENEDEEEFYGGMCGRSGFTHGHTYVVALNKTSGGDGWNEADYTFARSSRDYSGPNDPWVKTIRDFLDIQKRFASREQYEELKQLAEQLGKLPKSEARQSEIDEIERHLGIRSEFKPAWYLVETYDQLERGEALQWPWLSRYYWDPDSDPLSVEERKAAVLGFLIQRDHPEAAPFFERLLTKPKPTASELGSATVFVAQSGDLRRALDIISTRIAPNLAVHSLLDAMTLMRLSRQAMNGEWFWENTPWKDDPYVAERWPMIAFGFVRYLEQVTGVGDGLAFAAELDAIKPANFRDWPDWTLARAYFNDEVQAWAARELQDDALIAEYAVTLSSWDRNFDRPMPQDPARLPMQVMIRSHGDPRAEILEKAFCQGPVRQRLLINLLGAEARASDDERLFERMLATPSLAAEERMRIVVSLSELVGALQKRARLVGYMDGYQLNIWRELLATALSDKQPDIEPISCPAG
jgi:hypothetical protein